MTKQFLRIHILVLVIFVIGCELAYCGQMSSHVYTAIRSKALLSGNAAKYVNENEAEYLTGSQGPDIVGVVMPALDSASFFDSVGEETHYNYRKNELAVNILDAARTDKEKAYAIGWITHYFNDINVHPVVNEFGGFYKIAPAHHKELEQLETKHVIAAHSDIVTKERSELDLAAIQGKVTTPYVRAQDRDPDEPVVKQGPTFGEFIFDAYHTTYPDNDLYKNDQLLVKNRSYFCERMLEASGYCADASKQFYDTATKKDKEGKHSWALSTWKFPDMPSFEAYDNFFKVMELTKQEPERNKLALTIQVNDTKIYGRFLADWEVAADKAVSDSKAALATLSRYMDETDPTKKATIRTELVNLVPKKNLDQPNPDFDQDEIFPGDKPRNKVYYSCTITPINDPESRTEVHGETPEITPISRTFSGSEQGLVDLDIPIPANADPYEYDLKLSLGGKESFLVPRYENRDWIQVCGSSDGSDRVKVQIGEIFDVTLALTDKLAKIPGKRVWTILDENPSRNSKMTTGKIKGFPTAWGIDRGFVGKLPGNPEFIPQLESKRSDVFVVEQKVDGNLIRAKLQFTDPFCNKLLGDHSLVLAFQDREQASSMEYSNAQQKAQASRKAAKPVWDLIDKKVESLDENQRSTILNRMKECIAEYEKQGMTEKQIDKAMETNNREELKKLGLTLTPEQIALLDAAQADDDLVESKGTGYQCAFGKIKLIPVDISVTAPDGWTAAPSGENAEYVSKQFSKSVTVNGTGSSVLASSTSEFNVSFKNDPEIESKFMENHTGDDETQSGLKVGTFIGTAFSRIRESGGDGTSPLGSSIEYDCLLKSGSLYMNVRYNIIVHGYKETNEKGEVVKDGIPIAKALLETLHKEADAMLKSTKLAPRKP